MAPLPGTPAADACHRDPTLRRLRETAWYTTHSSTSRSSRRTRVRPWAEAGDASETRTGARRSGNSCAGDQRGLDPVRGPGHRADATRMPGSAGPPAPTAHPAPTAATTDQPQPRSSLISGRSPRKTREGYVLAEDPVRKVGLAREGRCLDVFRLDALPQPGEQRDARTEQDRRDVEGELADESRQKGLSRAASSERTDPRSRPRSTTRSQISLWIRSWPGRGPLRRPGEAPRDAGEEIRKSRHRPPPKATPFERLDRAMITAWHFLPQASKRDQLHT
ncbi:hypothetical protein ATK36_0885 [Amycolatopsis sulphurea]|uniref:Uncharacterized protein n=1 Tax=Amycolatopsis sulphurea TaxID=76022 RepID=A0A2A9G343_9PSEU|nr:hypothetical protein ATK36_0885 [Amycolatopsis sulphurea]